MERVMHTMPALVGSSLWLLRHGYARAVRALGVGGLAALLAAALFLSLVAAVRKVDAQRMALEKRPATARELQPGAGPLVTTVSGLEGFRRNLTPHEDIPQVLSDLFELATQRQIVLVRGEYRTQVDEVGGFVRYRMSFPVKGQAAAIQAFIEEALVQHRSLAFDSIQFKREKIEVAQVEARIQWTLFTQLPPATDLAGRRAP
jgi:hypothetical protein